ARSLNATFVATDMFGESRIAARRASSPISARWAALNPVVPITARAPLFATSRRWSSEASGTENSMSTRSGVIAAAASAPPAAPATTTCAVGVAAAPVLGDVRPSATLILRLLDEGVRLEDRAELLAVGVAHAAHGQPELRLQHAGHRHRLFDRDGIGLEERRPRQREEPVVQLPGPLPVAVERRV